MNAKDAKKSQRQFSKISGEIKSNAIHLIHTRLPQKVIAMHKMVNSLPLGDLESIRAVSKEIDDAKVVSGSPEGPIVGKKRKLETTHGSSGSGNKNDTTGNNRLHGHVPCNNAVVKLIDSVKSEVNELIETVGVHISLQSLSSRFLRDGCS